VESDPTWPAQGVRLAARVARAAGPAALRVDHHGSTAVPGLAARDVVDLQLVVPGPAAADGLRAGLAAAGFVRREGDGRDGRERVYASADPARRVTLQVRTVADDGWRDALLFRDWLRAHAGERDAYASVKRAARGFALPEYRARTGPWITVSLERARAWARVTGRAPDVIEE
jgi:dephospho-CoA kinase